MANKLSVKTVIFSVLCLPLIPSVCASSDLPEEGEYTHTIRQCEGTSPQAQGCVISEEGIEIKRQKSSNAFYLYVKTRSGSIYHFCEYSAIAKWNDGRLEAGNTDYCKVTVSFDNGSALLKSEGDGCREFCSAQASLYATNLTKKMRRK